MAMAAADPSPAAVMTWARGFTALPAAQTPGTLVRPVASTATQPFCPVSQPTPVSRVSCGTKCGRTNTAERGTTGRLELDAGQLVRLDDEAGDGGVDDTDGASDELLALRHRQRAAVGEEHHVVRPLADDVRVRHGVLGGGEAPGEDAQGPVLDLVAVAVGAVEDVATPPLPHTRDVRDDVAQPGRDQDTSRPQS